MESSKKDINGLGEEQPESEEQPQSVGLSSAMHDIRTLAQTYASQEEAAGQSLHLGEVTMQPELLLLPAAASRSDRWAIPALVVLMILGLSTSVLALVLYAKPESLPKPVYFQTQEIVAERIPELPTQAPAEVPLYDSADSVEPAEAQARRPAASWRRTGVATRKTAVIPKSALRAKKRHVREEVAAESTCDEVGCLIDSSDACCSQYPSVRKQQESLLSEYRPHRPERSKVMAAMKSIEPAVLRCFDEFGETGIASVDFVIGESGAVRGVELGQGSLGFRACVREQLVSLHFEPLSRAFKMSFPFRR